MHLLYFIFFKQIAFPKGTMFTDMVVWLSTLRSLKNVRENVLWIRHVLLLTGSQPTWGNPVGFWQHPMLDLQRNLELLLTTCCWTELAWVSRLSYTFMSTLLKVCDISQCNGATSQSNGIGQTSTPHRCQTFLPITIKLCTINYVH